MSLSGGGPAVRRASQPAVPQAWPHPRKKQTALLMLQMQPAVHLTVQPAVQPAVQRAVQRAVQPSMQPAVQPAVQPGCGWPSTSCTLTKIRVGNLRGPLPAFLKLVASVSI